MSGQGCMKVLNLELRGRDNPSAILSREYPEVQALSRRWKVATIGGHYFVGSTQTLIFPDEKQVSDAIKLRKNLSAEFHLLEKGKNHAKCSFISKRPVDKGSLTVCSAENGAILLDDIITLNNVENLSFLVPSENISRLIEHAESLGEVKISSIRDYKPRGELTVAEELAFRTAINHGYYSWPRRITLEELAEKLGLSRRGFQDNLRRAESKIMHVWKKERFPI